MVAFDIVDEAIIGEEPQAVFQALVELAAGRAQWWRPYLSAAPRAAASAGEIGSVVDVRVRPGRPRFAFKICEAVPGERLRVEYVEGDFRGEGTWTMEPIGDETRLRFRWRAEPRSRLIRVLSRISNLGRAHSKLVNRGFAGLNHYVLQNKSKKPR